MSDFTQTQVSAAPAPGDDPPGQNGESFQADDVMAVLQGPAQIPAQQQQQTPTPQAKPLAPTPPQPQTQQQLAPGAPAQPGMQPQAPQGQPQAPAQGAADPLQSTLHRLDQTLQGMRQPQQPRQPAEPPSYDRVPDYGYNIPAEVMQGLSSEDPVIAQKALGTVATGISRHVHQTVLSTTKEMIRSSLIPYIMNEMRNEMATTEVYRDFYGTYQDLNDPVIRPMVVSLAQQMAQSNPNFAYSPTFKQQLAQEIYKRLGRAMPGQQQPQVVVPPQAPPAMAPQGTRQMGGRTGPWTEADDIADTVLN